MRFYQRLVERTRADRAYLLETGTIAFSGSSAEIRDDEAIRNSYLGY